VGVRIKTIGKTESNGGRRLFILDVYGVRETGGGPKLMTERQILKVVCESIHRGGGTQTRAVMAKTKKRTREMQTRIPST